MTGAPAGVDAAWAAPAPAALLDALDATWAALERKALGPWTLRRGGGGGNRASSALPRGRMPDDLDGALAALRAQSAAWGQPALAQLGPDDAALDAALDALGWTVTDRNVIYAAPAAALAQAPRGDIMVVQVAAPLASLDELWAQGGIGPARRAVMDAVACPKTTLLLRVADRPAAAAFVARCGRIAVLSALHVAPERRRCGAGAAAVRAAAAWALEGGADTLALAVTQGNAPARALYDRLGFGVVCGYHYRQAPQEGC